MSMGAVLHRTGTALATDLGGLYKSMPLTTGLCIVGAASISAFPLCAGFVSKSMILSAAAQAGHFWVWVILLFASAGALPYIGIRAPFAAFYAHDSGKRPAEGPTTMLLHRVLAAAASRGVGGGPRGVGR